MMIEGSEAESGCNLWKKDPDPGDPKTYGKNSFLSRVEDPDRGTKMRCLDFDLAKNVSSVQDQGFTTLIYTKNNMRKGYSNLV